MAVLLVPVGQFDSAVHRSAVHGEFTAPVSAAAEDFDESGSHSSQSYWFIVFNDRP